MMQNRIFFKRRYDKTAAAISEQLGLTHAETMNSKTVKGNEIDMLVNTLYDHMRDIDDQANKLIEVLQPKYKAMYEVTEQLKADDQLEWVRRINTIMHQIDEIILNDIVYN